MSAERKDVWPYGLPTGAWSWSDQNAAFWQDLRARGIRFDNPTPASLSARQERCTLCGNLTTDWVDPDWAHGRICRACETKHEP